MIRPTNIKYSFLLFKYLNKDLIYKKNTQNKFTLAELNVRHGAFRLDFHKRNVQSPDADKNEFLRNGDHANL